MTDLFVCPYGHDSEYAEEVTDDENGTVRRICCKTCYRVFVIARRRKCLSLPNFPVIILITPEFYQELDPMDPRPWRGTRLVFKREAEIPSNG